ncbi:MAG: YraN family protein [Pleurocapsa sp. MO_226.B13]|nr:YraN family protein [Pleurocapsa sp. MO_226.B13]
MKDIGGLGERLVVRWLKIQNYHLLGQNWRCRWGEIDIIALDKESNTIAFVEVKTRSKNNWDENGLLAVDYNKQDKIWKTASLFLAEYPQLAELPCRFDVALVSYKKCFAPRRLSSNEGRDAKEIAQIDIGQSVTMEQYHLTIENYLQSAFE